MSGEAAPAIWLLNPFDWDGGWHVLVKGGPKPEPGAAVTVTRRDGSESVETVVAVVCSHHPIRSPGCLVAVRRGSDAAPATRWIRPRRTRDGARDNRD